jgi:serine-type D-Ala-D-Ala carboxypeptidase/endopeptidase
MSPVDHPTAASGQAQRAVPHASDPGVPPVKAAGPVLQRRRLLLGTGAVLLAPCSLAQPTPSRAVAPTALERALQERVSQDIVGLAAAQVGPDGTHLHTLGLQRHGGSTPVGTETLFELGSLTKPFIALLLADGVLAKRLSFDDAVEEGLPDGLKLRDSQGEPLRLIDLATHRSGLPRMPTNLSPKEMDNPYPHYSQERLQAFIRSWRPQVPRGSRFEYSNLGYGLLAQVLAQRGGHSLDQLLSDRIFKPLGLRDLQIRRPLPAGDDLAAIGAALGASLALAPREATGHDARRRPVAPWQFGALAGAIGLVGPITPVARFIEAALGLFDHPLEPAFEMCFQQRSAGEHPLHPFALAWEVSPLWTPRQQRDLYNQDGATSGFSASMWIDPSRRRGAVVLANSFVETRELALQVLDPALNESQVSLPPLPTEALEPLVGRFRFDAAYAIDLRSRNGRLWAQGPGQPEFELIPASPRHFYSRDGLLQFKFDGTPLPRRLEVLREGHPLKFAREP